MAVVELPFSTFCNRFAGATGWVVGRGPTTFHYEDLAAVDGPVFFINDAVSQERHLRKSHPSFFFAHDAVMATWLSSIRSIAVLPDGFPLAVSGPPPKRDGPLPRSRRRTPRTIARYRAHDIAPPPTLLSWTREEVARERRLFTQTATIHSALHFVWFVGCAKVRLIGCDGLPKIGYDPRLPNRSATSQWASFFARLHQDRLLESLVLPAEYVGTPPHLLRLESSLAVDPHRGAAFRDAMQGLLGAASGIPGCRQATLHQIGHLDVYVVRVTWDDIRHLLRFVQEHLWPWMARPEVMAVLRAVPSIVVKTDLVAPPPIPMRFRTTRGVASGRDHADGGRSR